MVQEVGMSQGKNITSFGVRRATVLRACGLRACGPRAYRLRAYGLGACGLAAIGGVFEGVASAQLRPEQVLVVYDSRIADSRAVAEYYAGSAAVPGGSGSLPGTRPGVRVFNLASTSAPITGGPDITHPAFIAGLRNPIRAHLISADTARQVRVITLTKGLAHRVDDTDNPGAGENFNTDPPAMQTELLAGDLTYCSVDSELTLLWQNLGDLDAGGGGDSQADGMILNPYHTSGFAGTTASVAGLPFAGYDNSRRALQRTFTPLYSGFASGFGYRTLSTGLNAFGPGDVMLVTRLDAPTVADVRAMLDRALVGTVNTEVAAIVLDESRSDGIAQTLPNASAELDSADFVSTGWRLWQGDDFEDARDLLRTIDGRWNPALVRYDSGPFPNNYLVGPRIDFGLGLIVGDPIVLLGHEGANTDPINSVQGLARRQYPASFNWVSMGVYNTLESFNARAFGTNDSLFNQSQAGEAIAAGATFAIGHAWEPFSQTAADSEFIVRRFLLGTQSWAEAAWASIPVLSWQQVVIGDPLARVRRTSDDRDNNGRNNIDDLYTWERQPVDITRDGLANNTDRRLLELMARPGAGVMDMVARQR